VIYLHLLRAHLPFTSWFLELAHLLHLLQVGHFCCWVLASARAVVLVSTHSKRQCISGTAFLTLPISWCMGGMDVFKAAVSDSWNWGCGCHRLRVCFHWRVGLRVSLGHCQRSRGGLGRACLHCHSRLAPTIECIHIWEPLISVSLILVVEVHSHAPFASITHYPIIVDKIRHRLCCLGHRWLRYLLHSELWCELRCSQLLQ